MILAVLQARFSSSRLPGKVLMDLLGEPMLYRQIERILRSKRIDRLVVATSIESSDDQVWQMCLDKNLDCFRGSLEDVLDRFYQAAKQLSPEHVVRLTGDCPLTDPVIIDSVVELHLAEGNDYTSNTIDRTFPDGLDVEIISWQTLKTVWENAALPPEREHVTPYVYNRPEQFRLGCLVRQEGDISYHRWTVDFPEDFLFVQKVYETLYPQNSAFTTADVLTLLREQPELEEINKGF
ncbi:MAG: cytidylyltransferase domain-containing protein [Aminivibrio sp.]|jgi:spore coat polysaccharide biosynthesis protein SpsF